MAPALPAGLIGREAVACVLLGAVLVGARALFPEFGRGAFLPDVLAAAGVGAWAAERVLRGPGRGVFFVLGLPLQGARRLLTPVLLARKARSKRAKERRNAKRNAKKQKKNLPRPQRMLYNSNVSK